MPRRRSIEKQLPEAAVTAMLQASLHWKEGKPREADAALAALAASGGSDAAEASLMRAQLAAARGDSVQALAHLSVREAAAAAAASCGCCRLERSAVGWTFARTALH